LLCSAAEKGNLGMPQLPGQGCSFHSFRTNTYKLSFMESPSGIKVSYNKFWVSFVCLLEKLMDEVTSGSEVCTLAFIYFFIDNCSYLTLILYLSVIFINLILARKVSSLLTYFK